MSSRTGSHTESTDQDGPAEGIPTDGFRALEQLYRSAPIGLALLDSNLRYVMINERLAAINGKPAAAHIGRTIREVIPEIASQVEVVCRRVIDTGEPALDGQVSGTTPADSDTERYWQVSYHPLHGPDGTVQGVQAIVQDITKQRRAEQELRAEIVARRKAQDTLSRSEQRLRELIEAAPDAVVIIRRDGKIMLVNRQTERIFGYQRQELIGRDIELLVPERLRGRHVEHRQRYSRDPRLRPMGADLDLAARHRNGREIPVEISLSPLESEEGMIVFCSIRDVSERKRAEDALRKSEQQYRDLYDNSPDMYCSVDADSGKITRCNQTVADKTGFRKDEIVGRHLFEMYHPECLPEAKRAFHAFHQHGEVRNAELQLRRADGGRIDVSLNVSAIRDEAGKILRSRSVWRDISQKKRAERAETRTAELNKANTLLAKEIAERAQIEKTLRLVLEGTSAVVGADFYRALVRHLAAALETRFAFVSRCHPSVESRIQILAIWEDDDFLEPFEYDIKGTPCEHVFADGSADFAAHVCALFPEDQWLKTNNIESYLAIPLFDSTANSIGHMGVMHVEPMSGTMPRESVLRVFAARAAAELERSQAVQAIHLSVERYRSLVDTICHGVEEIDAEGIITVANPAHHRLYEYEEGELIGTSILELVATDAEREELREYLRLMVEQQPPPVPYVGRKRTKSGKLIDIQVDWDYKRDAEGRVTGFISIITDTTERERARAALVESETRARDQLAELEHLYLTSPVGLCLMDTSLRFLRINQWLADINGVSVESHIGRTLRDIVPEIAQSMESVYRKVVETGEPVFDVMASGATPAQPDKVRHFLANYYPLKTADGVVWGLSSIVQDVTERERIERELRRSHEDLELRVRARTAQLMNANARLINAQEDERRRIARELHDDFNQRLALISVELEVLEQESTESGGQAVERLHKLATTTKQLSSDIHQLSHQLHPAKLDQLGLVAAARSYCAEISRQNEVQIAFTARDVPTTLPQPTALCLYRVIQEALRNVVKHSQAADACVELIGSGDAINLRITDSGVGFDLAQTTEHEGLGIVSMRERVRAVNGEISIHTGPGEGTRVEVSVPLSASS